MNLAEQAAVEAEPSLRITEIFRSLQGEALFVGAPTVFVRLTGCPLRCTYCDTAYAFTGGERQSLQDIVREVQAFETEHVCVTGGEPLAQPTCHALLSQLCDLGLSVSLETSGALDVSNVDPRVVKVLDLKTPSSNEAHRNLWSNLEHLTEPDQIKMVVGDRSDFDWACEMIRERGLSKRCTVWLSPSHEELEPGVLADWILEAKVPVRLQVQLHKYLWGDVRGR
ncbi:MAG: 7-carboxy-7-deazaguanine synthase QueE [Pseudomonadota bacterium]